MPTLVKTALRKKPNNKKIRDMRMYLYVLVLVYAGVLNFQNAFNVLKRKKSSILKRKWLFGDSIQKQGKIINYCMHERIEKL